MIPKKIHYCWFGGNPKPNGVLDYIESWKKYCPDYEIIEWNEQNFDVNINRYCSEACKSKKWAFVSDVARLWALYQEGGIYMDTDVEVIKPLDELLNNEVFFGFEGTDYIGTNMIGSKKEAEFIKKLLKEYDTRQFIRDDGTLDTTTNVSCSTKVAVEDGLILNGTQQLVKGVMFYPPDYFCPYDYTTGKLIKTANTFSIHWYSQTWISPKNRLRLKITKPIRHIFGANIFNWFKNN